MLGSTLPQDQNLGFGYLPRLPRRTFVFGQSRASVSAGFTNVKSLAVAAFDLVFCSLSVLQFDFVLDISKQSP